MSESKKGRRRFVSGGVTCSGGFAASVGFLCLERGSLLVREGFIYKENSEAEVLVHNGRNNSIPIGEKTMLDEGRKLKM